MRNLLYIAGLMLALASCEKDPITIVDPTEPVTVTPEPKPEPVIVTPTPMPPTHTMTPTVDVEQPITDTITTTIPADAITDDPRLTFHSTDGKGGNEYIINNRPSDNAPAFIVSIDGDYRPVYGSDGNRVQIQAGSSWFITGLFFAPLNLFDGNFVYNVYDMSVRDALYWNNDITRSGR